MTKELVVASGKGGTGKTSLTASFAAWSTNAVVADCDVDAPDLHLLLTPKVKTSGPFIGGKKAKINPSLCIACGECLNVCRFDAVKEDVDDESSYSFSYAIDAMSCEGCGVCIRSCPVEAITGEPTECGKWFVSKTRFGPMVHAQLEPGEENSGKLVTLVRNRAADIAKKKKKSLILIDGPPGIGCSVAAALTGVDALLAVTEPTMSGQHDLMRLLELSAHFDIPTSVCVNKWDLNPDMASAIETDARARGTRIAPRIRYDTDVTRAQISGVSPAEFGSSGAAKDMREVWEFMSASPVSVLEAG